MKVMVTGAAGFIGGVTVLKLVDQGHEVLGVDRVIPNKTLIELPGTWWHTGDFAGEIGLETIKMFEPEAIIHCAGTSLVGPSVADPAEYYNNNFVKTKILLDYLIDNKLKHIRFIFSSSAATYGNPIMTPINEVDPTEPISPYGESKLMIDWMLKRYAHAYELNYVSFRYFNACGADSQARHGQAPGATHIIARVLESIKAGTNFTLYGTDYSTNDGTCVRDYVHVEDLAEAHILATDPTIPSDVYNLGTNIGYSNLDIIQTAATVTKIPVTHKSGLRRDGDPAVLIADAGKFTKVSNWTPKFNLEDIVTHAWAWYNKL
jgi:UDP-glucose 4-epimerase